MNKNFPVDIFSITDIEKWSEDFYWPVSQEYIERMGEDLYFEICRFIHSINDRMVKALYRIQISYFFVCFCDLLHALKVIEELKKQRYSIIYDSKAPYQGSNFVIGRPLYKEIIENGVPSSYELNRWKTKYKDVKSLLKARFRFARNELTWHVYNLYHGGKRPIVVFNPNRSLLNHLEHTGKRAVFTSPEQWMVGYRDYLLPQALHSLLKDTSIQMAKIVNKTAQRLEIPFTAKVSSYVENLCFSNLEYAAKLFGYLVNNKRLSQPIDLWTGSPGNFAIRILSEATRFREGAVTHFTEIGGISYFEKMSYVIILLTTNDCFAVYNSNEIPLYKKLVERFPLIQEKEVSYFPVQSDDYKQLWLLNKNKPFINKQIKEVMFVPSSYQGDSRLLYHAPDLVRLDWENRLIKVLISLGYNVIYKKHPKGRLQDMSYEFFKDSVKYVYARFRMVMDMADAFIFDTVPSTAMYEAMCTRKPVILIYCNVPKGDPEHMAFLAKRCRIIPAKFDERNRIILDEEALRAALSEPIAEPDYEYLERYMFPQTLKAKSSEQEILKEKIIHA